MESTFASLKKDDNLFTVGLERAVELLAAKKPMRFLGMHPRTYQRIMAGLGPHGPYVRMGDTFASLETGDDPFTITLERALDLLTVAQKLSRVLGVHPRTGKEVMVKVGPYGPYVKHEWTNASLGGRQSAESITLAEAVALVDAEANWT